MKPVKFPALMKSPPLYFEFTRNALKVFNGTDGAEYPLERASDGRLTPDGREKLVSALKQLLKSRGWPVPATGWCAIDARGVSLRCLLLPAVAGDALYQVVRLQIEGEFPLPPDELAWGYYLPGQPQRQPDGSLKQSVLVAAVKKEVIDDYSAVLAAVGVTPVFTISALARAALCPLPPTSYGVLELEPEQSELAVFDGDASVFVRVLPQGRRSVAQSGEAALDLLAKAVRSRGRASRLYIFGDAETAWLLARRLANEVPCEPVSIATGDGRSSAIFGLKKMVDEQGNPPLSLLVKPVASPKTLVQPALVEWGVRAALLLLAVLLFPSLEAMLLTAPLAEKVEAFQATAGQVETTVDRDLDFLQDLKQNQPPYLESVYVISQAAPPGIHIDSLTMNRLGAVALRGSLRNGDQVADFRAKLIASGFFATVTVEEQTPTPDHQKVSVRMTAQWQPMARIKAMAVGPSIPEAGGTNAAPDSVPGGPGNGGGN